MKKYLLIGTALIIVGIIFFVRINYYKELEKFQEVIKNYEEEEVLKFTQNSNNNISKIVIGYPQIAGLVQNKFLLDDALLQKDTVFKYYYLSEKIVYSMPSYEYYDYLIKDCLAQLKEEGDIKEIKKRKDLLGREYGEAFNYWYGRLENSLIDTNIIQYNKLKHIRKYEVYNKNKWDDFVNILKVYKKDLDHTSLQNKSTEIQYKDLLRQSVRKLAPKMQNEFTSIMVANKARFMVETSNENTINTSSFGRQIYSISKLELNRDVYANIFETELAKQWQNYQLSNGAMPYSSCYGRNNYCSGYNCSQISVTSGNYDVVVLIKNTNGRVVRHAYIQAYDNFTFDLSNGNYQVFFYSGKGWNPYKQISKSPCEIYGGFVDHESYGKDDYISIYDQILSYRLTYSTGGNFSMRGSSKNEAF